MFTLVTFTFVSVFKYSFWTFFLHLCVHVRLYFSQMTVIVRCST